MSATKLDWAKVTQMLDNGWQVRLFRCCLGSYSAIGFHPDGRVRDRLAAMEGPMGFSFIDDDGTEEVTTDDFTPEQALTRLAYKVHGEVI